MRCCKSSFAIGLAGLIVLPFVLAACGGGAAVSNVSVVPAAISPNADGVDDIARIAYTVRTPSLISIYLSDAAGKRYMLRDREPRNPSPAPYELLFSGVSEGHLIPNGNYTWHIEADSADTKQTFDGPLTLRDASLPFPEIKDFTISSQFISPNRDAIDDHIYINAVLTAKARLSVYVLGTKGYRFDVPRREGIRILPPSDNDPLNPGRYEYDYDGGINSNAEPPPDGAYTLVAESEDRIGQRHVLTRPITLQNSGRPQAEITIQPNGEGLDWSSRPPRATLQLGDTIRFTATVRNTGSVPIRTAGPFSGSECYRMGENWYSKGFKQEPGIFRVGVDFESNSGADHPFRWGVGTEAELDVVNANGVKLYYLGVNKQAVVSGCMVLDKTPLRNPFYMYGALIQEDVEIANFRVSPLLVELVTKTPF